MKPFLGIDITTNRKNERLNGNEFLILKPSEILSQTLAKTTEQKMLLSKSPKCLYFCALLNPYVSFSLLSASAPY